MQDAEELSRKAEKRRKATERQLRREEEMREDGLLPVVEDDGDDDMVTWGGENMREISWIWTVAGSAGTDEELEDGEYFFRSSFKRWLSNEFFCIYSTAYRVVEGVGTEPAVDGGSSPPGRGVEAAAFVLRAP
jgi:hypothetical protein